jgi:Icc-related predicted phosphoesterase
MPITGHKITYVVKYRLTQPNSPMKFHLISDCHINFADLELHGGDVLVMAGDIIEVGHLRLADNTGKDSFLADRYRRFIREELTKYKQVIWIKGNHEFYHNSFSDTHDRLLKELPDHVHLLEQDTVEIHGILFYGATLWTDCNRGDPVTRWTLQNNMYDYRGIRMGDAIKMTNSVGSSYWTSRFSPEFTQSVHKQTLEHMKQVLTENTQKPVVVVTHHAPSAESLDPVYKHDYHMNGGYHSNLQDFIMGHPNIRVWAHGHVHHRVDYQIGNCRVVTNPRGYSRFEHIADTFDSSFTVEVNT